MLLTTEVTGVWTGVKATPASNYSSPRCVETTQLPQEFNIVVNVVLVSIICILGLVGNTLSVFVLQRERGNRVAVLLLQALAVADNACLTLSLIYVPFILGILPNLPERSSSIRLVAAYFRQYIEPVAFMAQTGTIWTVVLLAANRYFAVCRPFQAHTCLTLTRTKIQVAAVVIFSLALNAPRFFQVVVATDPLTGCTILRGTHIGPNSKFGKIYTNALYTVIVLILPFVLLVFLNVRLVFALRSSRKNMRRNSVNRPDSNDQNITFVMVIIVVIFIVCHTPDRLIPIFNHFASTDNMVFLVAFQCISNILFVTNSSVNFVIYYLCRRRFRTIFKTRICGCMDKERDGSIRSLRSNPALQLHSREFTQECSGRFK